MARIGEASLKALLAVVLAAGLVPSAAYAEEAAARSASREESGQVEGTEGGGSPSAPADEPQPNVPQTAVESKVPSSDEPAQDVEKAVGAPSESDSSVDEEDSLEAGPEPSESPGGLEAVAASATITPYGELALDRASAVSLNAGEAASFVFTASSDGNYLFFSSGGGDTFGSLFADEPMAGELASDDDGGDGGNFSMSYWLSAGQTVYLKAKFFKDVITGSFSVSVRLDTSYDLSGWGNVWVSDASIAGGSFAAPEVHFLKLNSTTGGIDELVQGSDFEKINYLSSDGETRLEGEPERSGAYYIEVQGLAPYYGSAKLSFEVHDDRDLSNGFLEATGCGWAGNGDVEAPTLAFTPANGSNPVSLVSGEQYRIVGYQGVDGLPLDFVPADAGRYIVKIEGIAPFYGEASVELELKSIKDITALEYDMPASVLLDDGSEAVLCFTAPSDGLYAFTSFGSGAAGLNLYTDRIMGETVGGMDGGHGLGDVSIVGASIELAAGQTVYLKVWGWGGGVSVLASDGRSLEHAYASADREGVVSGEAFKAPALNVRLFDVPSAAWRSLSPGVDYRISGYLDASGDPVEGEPSDVGSYLAIVEGIGEYHGSMKVPFEALSDRDLRFFSFSVDGYPVASGEPIVELAISGYRYDDEGALEVELVQNRDFRIAGYRDGNGSGLEGPPSEPGEYIAIVEGMGNCFGGQDVRFQVYDPKDYSFEGISGIESPYEYTGKPVAVSPTVTAFDGTTLREGVDYAVEYENDRGATLSGPPVEPGSYYLTIRPIGHPVGGCSFRFEIVNSYDIGGNAYWDTYLSGSGTLLHTGSPVVLPEIVVRRDVGGDVLELVLGTDFQIKGFVTSNDVLLDGPPIDVGGYRVILEGVGRYSGERAVDFFVKSSYDITVYDASSNASILVDGTPIAEPSIDVYRFNDNGSRVELIQNRDFRIVGYRGLDGGALEGPPSEPGEYIAVVEGIGDYFGERDVWIEVRSPYDIGTFSAWVNSDVVSTGKPVAEPRIEVVRFGDEGLSESRLVQDRDFRVKGYEDPNGTALEGAPSEPGEYYVILEGMGDYHGRISVYLPVGSSKDLRFARVDLKEYEYQYTSEAVSLALAVTAYDGSLLREGEHYRLVFFAGDDYDRSHPLPEAPSEVGDYIFAVEAIGGGGFTGAVDYSRHFSIYDEFDLSTNAWMSLSGSLWVDGRDVFLYTGEPVTPGAFVFANGDYGTEGNRRLVEGVDYELSYAGNVGPFDGEATATIAVMGIGKYHGELTKEFVIVPSIDMSYFLDRQGVRVGWETDWRWYDRSAPAIEFFETGEPVMPSIQLDGLSGVSFSSPTDYVVSYVDAWGKPVIPQAVGSYRLVATGVEGGLLSGSFEIPFSIVDTKNLISSNFTLSFGGSFYAGQLSGGGVRFEGVHDVFGNITKFVWNLYDGAVALIEGLDYVVKTVREGVYSYFAIEGIGKYGGTVGASVYGLTAQESFDRASLYVNGTYADLWGDASVFLAANGSVQDPRIVMGSFSRGVDFRYEGLFDASGNAVDRPTIGDELFLKLTGLGAYEGCERLVGVGVIGSQNPFDLGSGSNSGLTVDDAMTVYDGDKGSYVSYLLKSVAPNVGLRVYSHGVLLRDGQGISVKSEVGPSGSSVKITASAVEGSGYQGSRSNEYILVDKYDLGSFVGSVVVNGVPYSPKHDLSDGVDLIYAGFSYRPVVTVGSVGGDEVSEECYAISLFDSSGRQVDSIFGEGSYELVVEGVGDWSGSVRVPIAVSKGDGIGLGSCTVRIEGRSAGEPTVSLQNGEARPEVSASFGEYAFEEGRDYVLEYGCNDKEGRGYVTVKAVDGGPLKGQVSRNFKIGGDIDLPAIASLMYVDGSNQEKSFRYAPVVQLKNGEAKVDVVVLVPNREGTSLEPLDARFYDVEYGDITKPGTAWVKVIGKNGYSGSLSANYRVERDPSIIDLSAAASTSPVQLGGTATFACSVEGAGSSTVWYRWEWWSDANGEWRTCPFEGARTPSMGVEATAARKAFRYRCAVATSDGRSAVTEPVALDVLGDLSAAASTSPVQLGGTATFSLEAARSPQDASFNLIA